MSRAVLEAMTERARAGVEIRLLLDDHGTDLEAEGFEALREAGGRVERFRPPRFAHLSVLHKRNHRRAIVVDGRVAYTGGAAVADTWLGDADHKAEWRDDMVRVSGALVPSVQAAFSPLWAAVTGEVLSARHFASAHPAPSDAGIPIARHLNVVSAPSQDHHPVRLLYWMSFSAARERIWITNPYVVPGESLCQVLEERARAGVDVLLITAGGHTDLAPVRWAAQHFYGRLLEAGVRIYEFQPSLIHSKLAVVDGVWSIIGSPNLDIRSIELNLENVLGIQDRQLGRELERIFERDLSESVEVTPEAWDDRSLWVRARGRVTALVAEQL
jgi:cardiolipin synthase